MLSCEKFILALEANCISCQSNTGCVDQLTTTVIKIHTTLCSNCEEFHTKHFKKIMKLFMLLIHAAVQWLLSALADLGLFHGSLSASPA